MDRPETDDRPCSVEDGLPVPRRHWSVLTLALGITLAVLDTSIANVALPSIAGQLGISAAQSVWIVNAYQLTVAVSLLPLAMLGEIIGFRRVYQAGLAVFVLGAFIPSFLYVQSSVDEQKNKIDVAVYVADSYNHKIKQIDLVDRHVVTRFGSGEPGHADGGGTAARFAEPGGIAFADGRLYIADTNNHAIRVGDLATGVVTTLPLVR